MTWFLTAAISSSITVVIQEWRTNERNLVIIAVIIWHVDGKFFHFFKITRKALLQMSILIRRSDRQNNLLSFLVRKWRCNLL
jgi:hypothetical protein